LALGSVLAAQTETIRQLLAEVTELKRSRGGGS
jgi:hypothetical protein